MYEKKHKFNNILFQLDIHQHLYTKSMQKNYKFSDIPF